jgi:hypothetical protein
VAPVQEATTSRVLRVALYPVARLVSWFSPPLDAEGKEIEARLQKKSVARAFKMVLIAPLRMTWRGVRKVGRLFKMLVPRALRLYRHTRYHVAVWVRGFVPRTDGSDGRH